MQSNVSSHSYLAKIIEISAGFLLAVFIISTHSVYAQQNNSIPSPTGLNVQYQCGTTTAVFKWNAVGRSGAAPAFYYVRINDMSNGWSCTNSNGDNCLDYKGGLSYSRAVVVGRQYSWWVHAAYYNKRSKSYEYSPAASSSFVAAACPTPTPIPSINLALNKTVVTHTGDMYTMWQGQNNSSTNTQWGKMVDGNMSTPWYVNTNGIGNQTVGTVDLGNLYTVSSVIYKADWDDRPQYGTNAQIRVRYSVDNINWSVLNTQNITRSQTVTITPPSPVTGRYFEIAWVGSVGAEWNSWGNIYELQVFGTGVIPTSTPTPTPTPIVPLACPTRPQGDANCDGKTDGVDFDIWKGEFNGTSSQKNSDFNRDNKIDLADFEIWRVFFKNPPAPTATPTPSNTPTPTPTPAPNVLGSAYVHQTGASTTQPNLMRIWAVSSNGTKYETKTFTPYLNPTVSPDSTDSPYKYINFSFTGLPVGTYTIYGEYMIQDPNDLTQVEYLTNQPTLISSTYSSSAKYNVITVSTGQKSYARLDLWEAIKVPCASYCAQFGATGAMCVTNTNASIIPPPYQSTQTDCTGTSNSVCSCNTNMSGVEIKDNIASGKTCTQICGESNKRCVGNGTDANGGNNKFMTKGTGNSCLERSMSVCDTPMQLVSASASAGTVTTSAGIICSGNTINWTRCRCAP